MKKLITTAFMSLLFVAGAIAQNCSAGFTYSVNPTNGATVNFTNTSAVTIIPGGSNGYTWNFDDGNWGSTTNPTHTYTNSGTYIVCLTAWVIDSVTGNGCQDTYCDTIVISVGSGGVNCQFNLQHYVDTSAVPNTIQFTHSGMPSSGYTPSYSWDFGDGNMSSTTVNYATHTYTQPGYYYACLTVDQLDSSGNIVCTYTDCDTIVIMNNNPNPLQCNASFYGDSSSTASTINVYNNSTPASSAALSVSYSWNFGDGSTSNQAYPTHTYASSGLYNLCLTVMVIDNSTGDSCVSTYCHQIGVDSSGAVYFKTNGPGFTLNVLDPATIGLTETVLSNVSLYPNPAQNEVTIDLGTQLEGKANWSLYDLKGMNLSNGSTSDIQTKVDISKLNTGVYILKVESGSAISNHKLQIVK